MELHREIALWLDHFKLIPSGSAALKVNASLSDVIAVLRDGVVLCQLVHSLDPSSVDMHRSVVLRYVSAAGLIAIFAIAESFAKMEVAGAYLTSCVKTTYSCSCARWCHILSYWKINCSDQRIFIFAETSLKFFARSLN